MSSTRQSRTLVGAPDDVGRPVAPWGGADRFGLPRNGDAFGGSSGADRQSTGCATASSPRRALSVWCLASPRGSGPDLRQTHVEHFVGFVEHEEAQGIEAQRASAEKCDRGLVGVATTMNAAFERAYLLVHGRTAVERRDRDARALAYLCAASATCMASSRVGTSTRPRPGPARGRSTPIQMEQGKGKRGSLAGACRPGLAEDIASQQQHRNGFAR